MTIYPLIKMIFQGYNSRNCHPTRTIMKIYLYGISSLPNFKLFWWIIFISCHVCISLVFFHNINKWSRSIYVFSVLSRGRVSFIIKQKEIHVFLSFCGFEDTTDAMRGKRYQKPCTFTIIYYIILKNWLTLRWIS